MVKVDTKGKLSVIIAAAGNASRFGREDLISKQFLSLEGKSLLIYSIEKFIKLKNIFEIIVVTNSVDSTNELIGQSGFLNNVKIKTVLGDKLRQDSVYNGFCAVNSSADLVAIHDVARPLFRIKDLEKCIEIAFSSGTAVPAVPVVDTIKSAKSDKDRLIVKNTLDRADLFLIQTPQVFSYKLLSRAYEEFHSLNSSKQVITDEAKMLEIIGEPVNLVIGDRKNIKITYPEDLEIAHVFLKELWRDDIKEVTIKSGV